jgi:hypothetical protein
MARRGSRPSLYEVGRMRLDREGQGSESLAESDASIPPSRFTPGSSLRLPMGFVMLGIVLVAGIILLAWWLGKGAGEDQAKAEVVRQGQARVLIDPLDPLDSLPQTRKVEVAAPAPAVNPVPQPAPEAKSPSVAQKPLSTGDPQIAGMHYFVLSETRLAGAQEIATFCKQHGLDVVVVSSHNARLAQVIALPGLATSRSSDPAYKALDAKIERVGLEWKQSGRQSSFSDRYLKSKGN